MNIRTNMKGNSMEVLKSIICSEVGSHVICFVVLMYVGQWLFFGETKKESKKS